MATVIKVNCEMCSEESELAPKGVHLFIYDSGLQFYSFFCPKCRMECRKDASDAVVNLLVQGGVEMTCIQVPEEFLEKKAGAPIAVDDVLDFVKSMQELTSFEELSLQDPDLDANRMAPPLQADA